MCFVTNFLKSGTETELKDGLEIYIIILKKYIGNVNFAKKGPLRKSSSGTVGALGAKGSTESSSRPSTTLPSCKEFHHYTTTIMFL